MTTADYLEQLEQDREDLVDNLETKGITGLSGDETFTELVPEVLNISGGGVDINDYFYTNPDTITTAEEWIKNNYVKKFDDLVIPNSAAGISKILTNWTFEKTPKIIFGSNITSLYRFAYNNIYIKTIDTSGFNSNITSLSESFYGCSALQSIDLSNISPTGNLSMYSAFQGCSNITSIDLSGLENVTSIRLSFYNCNNLNRLDIRKMLLTNTTNHDNTFDGVPTNCLIIVKDATQKAWMNTNFSSYINVQTVEEYEASLNS